MSRWLIGLLATLLIAAAPSAPTTVQVLSWSGILAPNRATDWTQAGVVGGIPSGSWTRSGSLIAAGSSTATIQSALNACGTNHYVELAAGTFALTSLSVPSNCELRGQGADQTLLNFSSGYSCHGFTGGIAFCGGDGTYISEAPTAGNWTANYTQGASTVTLSSTGSIVPNQTIIALDQIDDASDPLTYFVCQTAACSTEGGTYKRAGNRSLQQLVVATSITGNNVAISPPVIPVNYRAGQTPQYWLIQSPVSNAGVRNLSIQRAGGTGVLAFSDMNLWIDGVCVYNYARHAVFLFQTLHTQITNSYFFGPTGSDPYSIRIEVSTLNLIQNNILHKFSPVYAGGAVVFNAPDVGSVVAYNYAIGGVNSGRQWAFMWNHAYTSNQLIEGNIVNEIEDDNIHSAHQMLTTFRNYLVGWEPGSTSSNNAHFTGWSRYANAVGNVLGRSGYHTGYQTTGTWDDGVIYAIGAGNSGGGLSPDPYSLSQMMRWGNYDTVTGAVRWCTAASTPIAACTTNERGNGAAGYPALASPSQTLPASFYLSAKPSWWNAAIPWPAIGPDVTGGTVYGSNGTTAWAAQSVGGHANNIPALRCYKDIMGGPANGTGTVLTFNAAACYP